MLMRNIVLGRSDGKGFQRIVELHLGARLHVLRLQLYERLDDIILASSTPDQCDRLRGVVVHMWSAKHLHHNLGAAKREVREVHDARQRLSAHKHLESICVGVALKLQCVQVTLFIGLAGVLQHNL